MLQRCLCFLVFICCVLSMPSIVVQLNSSVTLEEKFQPIYFGSPFLSLQTSAAIRKEMLGNFVGPVVQAPGVEIIRLGQEYFSNGVLLPVVFYPPGGIFLFPNRDCQLREDFDLDVRGKIVMIPDQPCLGDENNAARSATIGRQLADLGASAVYELGIRRLYGSQGSIAMFWYNLDGPRISGAHGRLTYVVGEMVQENIAMGNTPIAYYKDIEDVSDSDVDSSLMLISTGFFLGGDVRCLAVQHFILALVLLIPSLTVCAILAIRFFLKNGAFKKPWLSVIYILCFLFFAFSLIQHMMYATSCSWGCAWAFRIFGAFATVSLLGAVGAIVYVWAKTLALASMTLTFLKVVHVFIGLIVYTVFVVVSQILYVLRPFLLGEGTVEIIFLIIPTVACISFTVGIGVAFLRQFNTGDFAARNTRKTFVLTVTLFICVGSMVVAVVMQVMQSSTHITNLSVIKTVHWCPLGITKDVAQITTIFVLLWFMNAFAVAMAKDRLGGVGSSGSTTSTGSSRTSGSSSQGSSTGSSSSIDSSGKSESASVSVDSSSASIES